MTEPIPAALAALMATFAAVDVPGVQLQTSLGAPLLEEPDYVAVGYSPTEDVPAVDVTDAIADAGMSQDLESFDVANQLSCATGDADVTAVLARVCTIFRALRSAVAADPKLGGVVARCRVAEYHLVLDSTGGDDGAGSVATINFAIHVEVWRRP